MLRSSACGAKGINNPAAKRQLTAWLADSGRYCRQPAWSSVGQTEALQAGCAPTVKANYPTSSDARVVARRQCMNAPQGRAHESTVEADPVAGGPGSALPGGPEERGAPAQSAQALYSLSVA